MSLIKEINKRRTFAIISHPDAGKTTITEKLLLYGGAINLAGTVKAKKSKKFATSDWMELEKKRGISVTSSVMAFPYQGHDINLIDTPGHQDFSEDTYRTLTAVDSVLMLLDAANGVEEQTIKLFKVCRLRKTPIMAFVNKMDRPGKDPFSLLEEVEKVLETNTFAMNWPIGMGDEFRGVYDRLNRKVLIYHNQQDRSHKAELDGLSLDDPILEEKLGKEIVQQVREEIELLDLAGNDFDLDDYLQGELVPVFFGSALNSFGLEPLLDNITKIAPAPQARKTTTRIVEPHEEKFTSFIFKIQANMDPSHRDRVAYMRICSGKFERGMKAFNVRLKRAMRLGRPTQFMAKDRSLVDKAYPGDIVGIHDPGIYKIGDTFCNEHNPISFVGIPTFAPEHFYLVQLDEPLKSKQLNKALDQLSEEGAVQVFRPVNSNQQYLGVVGTLQIDVVKFRIKAEYGVEVSMKALPYRAARWVTSSNQKSLSKFLEEQSHNICLDLYKKPTLLLDHDWRLKFHQERNPDLLFSATNELLDSSS